MTLFFLTLAALWPLWLALLVLLIVDQEADTRAR